MKPQPFNLVTELSRQVISEISPKEIPLFQATSEAYLKNPQKMLRSNSSKEEMLGFGVEQVALILTPVVLHVSTTVVKYVAEIAKDPIEEALQDKIEEELPGFFGRLTRFVRKLFGLSQPSTAIVITEIPALTQEQLIHVQKLAFEKACQFNLPEDQATLLAESLVGRLAVNS